MKQILIKNSPLALAKKSDLVKNSGTPLKRNESGHDSPTGFSYIDNEDQPTDAPEDGYRWQRLLTSEAWTWEEVAIPFVLPDPVSLAQFKEEITKSAYEVDGVTLYDIVVAAIGSDLVLGIWWSSAATVDRNNAKVLAVATALSVSSETLDAIFIGAALN